MSICHEAAAAVQLNRAYGVSKKTREGTSTVLSAGDMNKTLSEWQKTWAEGLTERKRDVEKQLLERLEKLVKWCHS